MKKKNTAPQSIADLLKQQNGYLTPEQAAEISASMPTPAPQTNIEKPLRIPSQAEIEYAAKVNAPKPAPAAKPKLTTAEVLKVIQLRGDKYLQKNGKSFKIDSENIEHLETLAEYFNRDPKFETRGENFSLRKCLLLRGDVGRGKSLPLKLFSDGWSDGWNSRAGFLLKNFISCTRIESDFALRGYESLINYTRIEPDYMRALQLADAGVELNNADPRRVYVFDDLGAEKIPVTHYKNTANVMELILMDRVEMFTDYGICTHITTNITRGEDYEKLYGPRIRGRIREQFNIINVTGPDRRK